MPIHCLGFGLVTCDRVLLVDQFPQPNQKLVIDQWARQVGGPVAVGLMTMAVLGVQVQWGLPLGKDGNAATVKSQFRDLGIGFLEAQYPDLASLPEALILVERRSGKRTVLLLDQPGNRLQQFQRVAEHLPAVKWIYCDGRDPDFVLALKDWARLRQAKLFFDLGSLRPNWERIVADAELVIVSDDFMRQLDAALTPKTTLLLLADCGVKISGMTLGREGSLFLRAGRFEKIPAFPVRKKIDATNAGDVFHGAFLAAWIKTNALVPSATFAARCAAWVAGHLGHQLQHFDQQLIQEFNMLEDSAV